MFGLDVDTLQTLHDYFAGIDEIDKVLIYGSRAKGNYKTGSDIDITLLGRNLTSKNSVYVLQDLLEESTIPYKFDISIFSQLSNNDFISHILRVGKTLYERKETLPKEWEVKTLREVCNIEYGTRVVKKKDIGEIYPVYGGGDATFLVNDFNREDRVVIARFAMSEKCTRFVEGRFFLNDSGLTISPKEKKILHSEFINYQIINLNDSIYSLGRGTAQRNLNVDEFKKINIYYPTIKKQKKIAAVLDKAFKTIATAETNIKQNITNAKELFQSKLNQVFLQQGSNWQEKTLGEVCNIIRGPFGGSLKKSCFVPSGNAVYEQRHAIHNQFTEIRYFINGEKYKEMKRFQLSAGDLIMSCSGTMGKVAIVPKGVKKGIINQALLKMILFKNINAEYLKYYMTSGIFQENIAKHTVGTAIKNVASVKILKEIETPLPPIDEQQKIVTMLDELDNLTKSAISNYEKQLTNIAELKKSLLQKAFSGTLTC